MSSLGAELGEGVGLTVEMLQGLGSYKLLERAFNFKHFYLPDVDLVHPVDFFAQKLEVGYDEAYTLVFICLAVSELKFKETQGEMSDLSQYIHSKIGANLDKTGLLDESRFSLTSKERALGIADPIELINLAAVSNPTKAVLYALTRFRIAQIEMKVIESKVCHEIIRLYDVPATLAVESLDKNAGPDEVAMTVGWILISLWLSGDFSCPDQLHWLSPTFREVFAGVMEERLEVHPAVVKLGTFPSNFFTNVVKLFPILMKGASSLRSGFKTGRFRSRSRGQSPMGDDNSIPGTPVYTDFKVAAFDPYDYTHVAYDQEGFITPGEGHERPTQTLSRAMETFMNNAKSRQNAADEVVSESQHEMLRGMMQNGFTLGRNFIGFDD